MYNPWLWYSYAFHYFVKHAYFIVTEHVKEVADDTIFIHDSTLGFPANTVQGGCM